MIAMPSTQQAIDRNNEEDTPVPEVALGCADRIWLHGSLEAAKPGEDVPLVSHVAEER